MQSKSTIYKTFNSIAKRYDLLNRILTLGLDTLWRRKLAKRVPKNTITLLDLATGTGDQIISILKRRKAVRKVFGLDLSEKMLQRAYEKIARYRFYSKVTFLHASSTAVPLDDTRMDCITVSFGMRNFDEQQKALQEMYRLLKPGGKLLILEFFQPSKKVAPIFQFFMKKIAAPIGKFISRDPNAYQYLFESIENYYRPDEFEALVKKCGFSSARTSNLFLSIVNLIEVTK
jgi:demethylmenaquinone methyltransferase / 2-methoxy-6-polyprenyl-1,4-benzoquinol methylase